MSARRKARKRALDTLFSADVGGNDLAEAIANARERSSGEPERASSWPYTEQILEGVHGNLDAIDTVIRDTSQAWPLERMPSVDRSLLRIGVWEIMFNDEVPAAVAIAEAVDLATELSTDQSAGFVHGILAAVAEKPAVS